MWVYIAIFTSYLPLSKHNLDGQVYTAEVANLLNENLKPRIW